MKNQHILPNTEVPIELRKEVYREALRIIESGEIKYELQTFENWLCWLLPSILWDYDLFIDNENKFYQFNVVQQPLILFPELKKFLTKKGNEDDLYTNQERINFLKSVI